MRKAIDLEDRTAALVADLKKLRDRAGKLWSETYDLAEQAEPRNAEDWRCARDMLLSVWLEEVLSAVAKATVAGEAITAILDRSENAES